MSDSAVAASARGASLLIILQVASRGLTFALNQLLLRFVSPELLGVAVQLDLYCISVLYFSRESLRVALQRRATEDRNGLQAVVNLAYLALAAGVPISFALAQIYLQTNLPAVAFLSQSLRIYGLAALVELLAEPAFVAAQHQLAYKTRATAEATATVAKTLVTVGSVVFWQARRDGQSLGVLPFAFGQLIYASALLSVYLYQMNKTVDTHRYSLLPRRIVSDTKLYLLDLFHRPLLGLSLAMTVQSGFKYLLTQGDSLLITTLASLSDQGAYALASNYGGLIARMLFQPIEEASRTLFARLCNPSPTRDMESAMTTLHHILHIYSLIALFAVSLGPSIAPPLLSLVLGSKWQSTNAGAVLAAYAYYIPLLATNGVTEAFVSAVATRSELGRQSFAMALNFVFAFVLPTVVFTKYLHLGAVGLVGANCINMAARIAFNLMFIKRFVRQATDGADTGVDESTASRRAGHTQNKVAPCTFNVRACLPGWLATSTAVVVAVLVASDSTRAARLAAFGAIGELVRIGLAGLVLLVVVIYSERHFIRELYSELAGTQTTKEKKKQ